MYNCDWCRTEFFPDKETPWVAVDADDNYFCCEECKDKFVAEVYGKGGTNGHGTRTMRTRGVRSIH